MQEFPKNPFDEFTFSLALVFLDCGNSNLSEKFYKVDNITKIICTYTLIALHLFNLLERMKTLYKGLSLSNICNLQICDI